MSRKEVDVGLIKELPNTPTHFEKFSLNHPTTAREAVLAEAIRTGKVIQVMDLDHPKPEVFDIILPASQE